MDGADENRKAFVKKLARENRSFYETLDGSGSLRAFELTFEHRWVYLFELVQNALDAGAHTIALRLAENGDALTFQHDGDRSLGEKDVVGLSKVFRSTKGASSVGFMGIGFKSVFRRFREARISGWGWTFRYEIDQVVGERYGDVQPDLLGAVVPIWDDAIAAPELGFTTRFEMRQRVDTGADLKSDLAHFLPNNDRTPLAILAASWLERLDVDGQVWELGMSEGSDGSSEATALSESENRRWQLFPVQFKPSREAIARFLEHRRIRPQPSEREKVYAEAARPRRVLGVLPLNDDGTPAPPTRGQVYATLPTKVPLPFGLHINADWLLNISRSGLPEIKENPWQRDIVDRIADVLASFLGWVARSFSEPAAAKAAFAALALPSPEDGGLEAILAENRWLSRLRAQLEDAAVLPVWTEKTGALAFAKPGDAIVPPVLLAKAFAEQPALQPAVLLKGPVLMREVLGSGARKLLDRAGLLAEMSPQGLELAWADGLESWWETLAGEESASRDLLFRVWAAVSELASENNWPTDNLPCVRTENETWLPVGETAFFNEPFPSEREPGGSEVCRFIQPFIPDASHCLPDAWINALRQGKARELVPGPLSQAWGWIEKHAQSIRLQEVVGKAIGALVSSSTPDWSVLVPLGYWAKHRNRDDLLTRVLVESESDPKGVPVGEALLADPYVERGQGRRRLFPTKPAISAAYLEQDPKSADAHEWRTFFDKAGAKGELKVRRVEDRVEREDRERVAEFLGLLYAPGSNKYGYTLLDFDIEPDLPDPGAPEELRAALAAWLDDGFSVLKGQGIRKAEYCRPRVRYYNSTESGTLPSAWVVKLRELAWVPCEDGELRRPRDVLPKSDPGQEDAPVARLSSELLSALQQEGVKFGTEIPEATPLRRLLATGSRLDAEELAQLLRECREQITTGEDRHHFEQAARELTVPSSDNGRVPLDRIVQRIGGQLRGTLGGWIVPLDRIDEALRTELEHLDFPWKFPDTSTGYQALAYLRDVWKRARSSPERLANEVRDVLPTAYAHCLEDCAKDGSLSERWDAAVPEAVVFAEQKWVVLAEADGIYFDNIEDRRFFPSRVQLRTVTSGHLGDSRSKQLRTVKALKLPLLSSSVTMEWLGGDEALTVTDDWISRFDRICELLRQVRRNGRMESDGTGTETGTGLRLIRVREIALDVSVGSATPERVPVNARLHKGILTVAGRPVQFGSDAAKELLRHFSFGQRGDLAADLTSMLTVIDNQSDFALAEDKFRRSFTPDFESPAAFQNNSGKEEPKDPEGDPPRIDGAVEPVTESEHKAEPSPVPFYSVTERGKPDPPGNAEAVDTRSDTSNKPEPKESGSSGGSYTEDRALARQNALAEQLESSLKGKIAPSHEEDGAGEARTTNGDSGTDLGDEEYREFAARYEREAGREPELGDPRQTGWDIRSTDPKTGAVRLIEVKGRGCPWNERPWDKREEVVELSRAQIRKAFEAMSEQTTGSWYLYVVEKTDDGDYQVLPIANPVHVAAKWILPGKSWRMVAKDPKRFASPPN